MRSGGVELRVRRPAVHRMTEYDLTPALKASGQRGRSFRLILVGFATLGTILIGLAVAGFVEAGRWSPGLVLMVILGVILAALAAWVLLSSYRPQGRLALAVEEGGLAFARGDERAELIPWTSPKLKVLLWEVTKVPPPDGVPYGITAPGSALAVGIPAEAFHEVLRRARISGASIVSSRYDIGRNAGSILYRITSGNKREPG